MRPPFPPTSPPPYILSKTTLIHSTVLPLAREILIKRGIPSKKEESTSRIEPETTKLRSSHARRPGKKRTPAVNNARGAPAGGYIGAQGDRNIDAARVYLKKKRSGEKGEVEEEEEEATDREF